jgi:hypothetical protein
MKSDTIQFGSFAVPLKEFATQGNAILGIRDSVKSGGGFNNALSRLRTLLLIDGKTDLVASERLIDE